MIGACRICHYCKHWTRHKDETVGSCQVTDLPEVCSYRLWREECTENKFKFAGKYALPHVTHSEEQPLVDAGCKVNERRVNAYYDAPFGSIEVGKVNR